MTREDMLESVSRNAIEELNKEIKSLCDLVDAQSVNLREANLEIKRLKRLKRHYAEDLEDQNELIRLIEEAIEELYFIDAEDKKWCEDWIKRAKEAVK